MKDKHKLSCIVVWLVGLLGIHMKNFMIVMESRVSEKIGLSVFESLGKYYYLLLVLFIIQLLLILIKGKDTLKNLICATYTSVLIPITLYICTSTVNVLETRDIDDLGRITYGVGVYVLVLSMLGIIIKCKEYIKHRYGNKIVFFSGTICLLGLILVGAYDNMGIMLEYYVRKSEFYKEFKNHLTISLFIIVISILIGIPIGYLSYRYNIFRKIMTSILNIIESIPTLSLICLLLPVIGKFKKQFVLLKKLGISGLGATPVFFALFFYAIFYLINMIEGALKTIDKSYVLVAESLGMSKFKIFWNIQLPIILPVLISSIRVALLRVISGAAIGAYVGYGGLGYFIYLGRSGFAIDIIMLGALPIMGMIFFFDYILKLVEKRVSINYRIAGEV